MAWEKLELRKVGIIGKGEVGRALYDCLVREYKDVWIRDIEDEDLPKVDVLNICYPYSDSFIDNTNAYIKQYAPKLTVVHSSVAVGTTRKLSGNAVHSPVRGRHPDLKGGLLIMDKFIGYNDEDSLRMAMDFMRPVFKIQTMRKTESTELAKALSLGRYGINLVFSKMTKELCDEYGLDYTDVFTRWEMTYNKGMQDIGQGRFTRPILTPLEGKIGGHCVLPVTGILAKQHPHRLLHAILDLGGAKTIGENTQIWHYSNVYDDAEIGANCNIGAYTEIGPEVKIGDGTRIGAYCFIPEGVTIGKNCFIAPKVCFANDKYPPSNRQWWGKIEVGDNAIIGMNSAILPGVKIGKGAFVAAGSVVTRDLTAGKRYAGNPAKLMEGSK